MSTPLFDIENCMRLNESAERLKNPKYLEILGMSATNMFATVSGAESRIRLKKPKLIEALGKINNMTLELREGNKRLAACLATEDYPERVGPRDTTEMTRSKALEIMGMPPSEDYAYTDFSARYETLCLKCHPRVNAKKTHEFIDISRAFGFLTKDFIIYGPDGEILRPIEEFRNSGFGKI